MRTRLALALLAALLLGGSPALDALELRLNAAVAAPEDAVVATIHDLVPEFGGVYLLNEDRTGVEGDRVILVADIGVCLFPVFGCQRPEAQSVLLPRLPVGDYTVEVISDYDDELLASAPLQIRERTELLLWNQQFLVEVLWDDPRTGAGLGRAVPITDDSGGFWFFQGENLEATVKVIDGRGLNDHFWIFIASMTDVGFTLKVTRLDDPCFVLSDPPLGPDCATRTYVQAPGTNRNFLDVEAFESPGGAS
jgi:hypothetical protein